MKDSFGAAEKPLRISITDNYPPYTIIGPDGTAFGLLVEMWRAWSKATAIPVEFVPSGWNETINAVRNGKVDIHSGLYKSEQRSEFLDFSEPLHVGRTSLHFRNTNSTPPTLEEMAGKSVASVKGTYQSQFLKEQHPQIILKDFDDSSETITALLKGHVDAVIGETVTIQSGLAKIGLRGVFKEGNETLMKNYIYAGVTKGNSALLKTINDGFKKVPRQELADIENRWLANRSDHFYSLESVKIKLTPAEKIWIAANPVTRIAVSTFINPVDIIDAQGNYSGLNADLIKTLNMRTGLNLVPEFFSKWPDLVRDTLKGGVDGAMSFSITPDRSKKLHFTSPYAYDPVVIITKSTFKGLSKWADLKGKKVSVVKSIAFIDDVKKAVEGDITFVESEEQGLSLLAEDKVDAHVSTLILYANAQKENFTPNLEIAASRIEEGGTLRVAINKEKPQLFAIVKKGLQSLTQDELTALRNKWLAPKNLPHPDAVLLNREETAWLKKHPITRIAVLRDWQPYDQTNKEGRHIGLHADLLRLINKHLGTNFIPLPFDKWKDAYDNTLKGDTDGILGLSWTKKRENLFYFSTPYHYKPADLVMRASVPPIQDWEALENKEIIVRAKASFIDKIKNELPNATIIEASSEIDALQRLSKGEGDVYLAWVSANQAKLAELDLVITAQVDDRQGEFTLGVPKSKSIVASIVQKGLNAINQEEWTTLKTRWLTQQEVGQLLLSNEETQWLEEHPSIDVAMMNEWPPISYTDDKGRPRGLNVALVNTLNKKLNGALRLRPGPFKENFQAVKNKEIPVLLDITPMESRKDNFNFTQNYLTIPHVYVARRNDNFINNEADLTDKTLALERGFGNVNWFKENHPTIKIKEYDSTSAALDAVSRNEADVYAGNRAVALYIIERELIHNLKLHGRVGIKPVQLAMGSRKDWPILSRILDKAISSLSDEERRKIFQASLPTRLPTNDLRIDLSEQEYDWIRNHKKIRVMAGSWAPFHFIENGQAKGMALDYVTWVLNKVGIEPEFIPLKWQDALNTIEKFEKIDLLPTIAHSKEREKSVLFSDQYLSYPRVIFSRKNSGFQSLNDLSQKTIAVEKNFITHKLLEKDFPEINLLIVDTSKEALEAVSFGLADAYVSNLAVGGYIIEKSGLSNVEVTGQTIYQQDIQSMGVRKDWPELVSIINKVLAVMPAHEKRKIRQKWLGQVAVEKAHVKKITLTQKEQEWVRAHPRIRVHNEKGWAPFNFYEDGLAKGFSIDYMKLIADKIGINIEFVTGPTWNGFLHNIKNKTLDVMLNIVKTVEREKYILFTDSYVNNPPMVVTRNTSDIKTFKDLNGHSVCVPEGFFYQEILDKNYPDISLVLSQDQGQCLKIVSAGRADATIGGLAIQDHLIKKLFLTNLKVAAGVNDPAFSNELRIGIRNDWPILQQLIQKAIKNTSEEEISPIRDRWISNQTNPTFNETKETRDFTLILITGATAIGFIVLLIIVRALISRLSKRDISKAYESREVKGTGIVFVGIFLSIIILAAWFSAIETEKETRQSIGAQLKTVLNTTHEAVRIWLKAETRYIDRMANDPELLLYVKDLLKINRTAIHLKQSVPLNNIRKWFNSHSKGRETQGFFIISPDNISIGSGRDKNLGTKNLISKARGERLALAFKGQTQFIPPIASDVEIKSSLSAGKIQEPTMFFAAPIFDENKNVIAVLTLRYDPSEDFTRIAQLGQIGDTGETYIFDKKATLITENRFDANLQKLGLLDEGINAILNLRITNPGVDLTTEEKPPQKTEEYPLTYMAAKAIKANNGNNLEGYRDYRGVIVLGAWVWDEKFEIGLATEINNEEALSTFKSLRLTMAIVLGLTVLVALLLTGLSVWIGQSANRSLRKARDTLELEVEDRTRELNFQKFALDKHAIVSATDAQGNITYVNDRFAEITGYSREEMIGQNHRFLKSGIHSTEFYEIMWNTISSGEVWHGELCNLNKDGGKIWLAASIIPFMGDDGTPERYISIRTDITERKLAEQIIKNSETRIRAIIDNAVDAIIVISATGIVQSFSPSAERIFGFDCNEVIGQNIKMLMPEQTSAEHDQYLLNYLAGRPAGIVGSNREVTGQRKDGTQFPMDLAVGQSVIDGENIFTGIVRDISDRKQAEKELTSNRNQLHDILTNIQQGVVLFDQEKCLVSWNAHYPEIINVDKEFLHVGMSLYDLALVLAVRGEYGEEDCVSLARERVDKLWRGEARSDLSFGTGRSYDAHSIRTADGRLVITYTDITQRKANEEIIARSMKLIQESISYASRIQRSLLPTQQQLSNTFEDHFLVWEPKDIVGGDICLIRDCTKGTLLVLLDCTGHGVPGAFMTMVVTGALDRALIEFPAGEPAILLARVNQLVKTVLNQIETDHTASDDGFECGICLINPISNELVFAGARFELWCDTGGEFEIYKGDKIGIGYRNIDYDQAFNDVSLSIDNKHKYYMASDGIFDQIGGERKRGFGKRRAKTALLDTTTLPMPEQEKALMSSFTSYQAEEERRDDVSVIGFSLNGNTHQYNDI